MDEGQRKPAADTALPTPPTDDGDEEAIVGPGPAPRSRPKRPLHFEQTFLDSLPSAHMYEKSYMHRDVVTHVAVSSADFFITGSSDGAVLPISFLSCLFYLVCPNLC
ncbi:hypothetical protein ZIOFF_071253 [Zingiber officinale]|uniref:Uncharacterized protein n=1 Tax=Zingiber officinale TaxID=94328 RepID=A0A8J5CUK5_ZINOF|nr:hypothetical protein ZIOFF_071253 [Zingiber officinale]